MTNNRKQALGKGLSALLSGGSTEEQVITTPSTRSEAGVAMVNVKWIVANPYQPRTEFELEALEELAESIKVHGIIQPVTLRKLGDQQYQLISGERRFRASQMAGLTEIPAYIRTADDQTMLEMALIENIQREDLNAIEVAFSYQRLIDECNLTQEQLSNRVAKKRSTITNYLRLLKLPAEIQQGIKQGKITMGHARALINAGDEKKQLEIYHKIIQDELSVREVEELVRKKNESKTEKSSVTKKSETKAIEEDPERTRTFKLYGDKLSAVLNRPIQIQQTKDGKGRITIEFDNDEQLEKIIEFFDR
jgi:ParB family chromosome partitioning protein